MNSIKKTQIQNTKLISNILNIIKFNKFDFYIKIMADRYITDNNLNNAYKIYNKAINKITKKQINTSYITIPQETNNFVIFHILIANLNIDLLPLTKSMNVYCHWAYQQKGVATENYFNLTKNENILIGLDGKKIYNISGILDSELITIRSNEELEFIKMIIFKNYKTPKKHKKSYYAHNIIDNNKNIFEY